METMLTGSTNTVQSADATPANEKDQSVTDANAPQALKDFQIRFGQKGLTDFIQR